MDTCPYYFELARGNGAKREIVACCRHRHSPVPCANGTALTMMPFALRCGGLVSKCQIPPHQQLDV